MMTIISILSDYDKINYKGLKMIADFINSIINNSNSYSKTGLTFQTQKINRRHI